jgi:hypothetical protein
MDKESTYTLLLGKVDFMYNDSGTLRKPPLVEIFHYDSFPEAFNRFCAIDVRHFDEKVAIQKSLKYFLENASIYEIKSNKAEVPLLEGYQIRDPRKILAFPSGVYYLSSRKLGFLESYPGIRIKECTGYNPKQIMMMVAKYDDKENRLIIDPGFERLQTEVRLTETIPYFKKSMQHSVTKTAQVFDIELPSQYHYSGMLKETSFCKNLHDACYKLLKTDKDTIDHIIAYAKNKNEWVHKVCVYDDGGIELVRLKANRYRSVNGNPERQGLYLHFNNKANPITAACAKEILSVKSSSDSVIIAEYSKNFDQLIFSSPWKEIIEEVTKVKQNQQAAIKRNSLSISERIIKAGKENGLRKG